MSDVDSRRIHKSIAEARRLGMMEEVVAQAMHLFKKRSITAAQALEEALQQLSNTNPPNNLHERNQSYPER